VKDVDPLCLRLRTPFIPQCCFCADNFCKSPRGVPAGVVRTTYPEFMLVCEMKNLPVSQRIALDQNSSVCHIRSLQLAGSRLIPYRMIKDPCSDDLQVSFTGGFRVDPRVEFTLLDNWDGQTLCS
jgi:hypothetical protein